MSYGLAFTDQTIRSPSYPNPSFPQSNRLHKAPLYTQHTALLLEVGTAPLIRGSEQHTT